MSPFLYLLALGAFTIGMEGLMIAGLLPTIADHLQVSLSAASWLVICFSATYAVVAPVAAALSASFERRSVMITGMAVFALGNLACAAAPDFITLIVARLVTAVAAALYMPSAMAYAGAAVANDQRGRALGLVGGGVTASLVLGVPLGTWIGTVGNWRWPFLVVAGLAAIAIVGLITGVPRRAGGASASILERLSVLKIRRIRATLAVTVLWATGAFVVFTFIAPVLVQAAGIGPDHLPPVMLAWGIAASLGSIGGGWAVDRFGARLVAIGGTVLTGLAMAALAGMTAMPIMTIALLLVWAVAGWAVNPAQQTRLIEAEPAVAQVSLSFHASCIYLGSALGSMLGSVMVGYGQPARLGLIGALCELAALSLLLLSTRRLATARRAGRALGTYAAPAAARHSSE
jgi:predicted MFS family arabinose efflux permease